MKKEEKSKQNPSSSREAIRRTVSRGKQENMKNTEDRENHLLQQKAFQKKQAVGIKQLRRNPAPTRHQQVRHSLYKKGDKEKRVKKNPK